MKPTPNKPPAKILAIALGLVPALAAAEYRCNAPQTRFDRTACEQAREGPDALRRYLHRLRAIDSLYFYDYVSAAQLDGWDAADRDTRVAERGRTPAGERADH